MKRFIQLVAAVKSAASLAFAAGIMIITVAAMFLRQEALPIGVIWQTVFLSMIFGVLQMLVFSDRAIPRMGTSGRLILLGASMLGVLAVFAVLFRWFSTDNVINWLVFIGLYAVVFAIATIVLRIVFRMGGLKYNELLTAYKTRSTGDRSL